jgi:hypothetical protein
MENVKKVAISIPNEGHTLPEAYDNHLVMSTHLGIMQERWKWQKRNPRYEFYWFTAGRLFTAMAREKLITQALIDDMDYILMYDDDMLLPLDMVDRMLADVEELPQIDVLAPLAFMRNYPHYPVIYTTREGYDSDRHEPYFINQFVKHYPKNSLIECDAVGFGAVLINMRIVKKMTPHYFFSTTGTGEDIYFCMKARQEAQARIFTDTSIKLGHLSNPKIIDEAVYEQTLKEKGEAVEELPHKYTVYKTWAT